MAFLNPDRVYDVLGLTVKEYNIIEHSTKAVSMPSKRTLPLLGITIHNTNDINEARQTTDPEQYTRSTINGNMGTVRVHFYVDDDEAWQNLPFDWQSWHAGQAGKADRNGSAAGNAQTISIECIMDGSGSEKDKRAEDNCAKLTAWLLYTHDMNTKLNLFTHNYWCNLRNGRSGTIDQLNKMNDGYKNCPVYIRPHWDEFVKKVNQYMEQLAAKPVEQPKTEEKAVMYNIVVGVYGVKENADAALKEAQKTYPNAFIKRTVKSS